MTTGSTLFVSDPAPLKENLTESGQILGAATLPGVFLGEDLLTWLVLAFGAAMAVGNVLALVRPPEEQTEGELVRAPVARSVTMAVIGGLAAIWALASLISG
jgi:hypothetical protein